MQVECTSLLDVAMNITLDKSYPSGSYHKRVVLFWIQTTIKQMMDHLDYLHNLSISSKTNTGLMSLPFQTLNNSSRHPAI
jgi:hypothetical protein